MKIDLKIQARKLRPGDKEYVNSRWVAAWEILVNGDRFLGGLSYAVTSGGSIKQARKEALKSLHTAINVIVEAPL